MTPSLFRLASELFTRLVLTSREQSLVNLVIRRPRRCPSSPELSEVLLAPSPRPPRHCRDHAPAPRCRCSVTPPPPRPCPSRPRVRGPPLLPETVTRRPEPEPINLIILCHQSSSHLPGEGRLPLLNICLILSLKIVLGFMSHCPLDFEFFCTFPPNK